MVQTIIPSLTTLTITSDLYKSQNLKLFLYLALWVQICFLSNLLSSTCNLCSSIKETFHNYKKKFGFRKGLSTDKALYKFLDEILCTLNHKTHVGGIFCDLAKAFDCMNHDILLKQSFYGMKGKAGQWFKSYLNCTKQRAEIKSSNSNSNSYSNWGIVKHEFLKVQYLVLFFSSYISMMILVLLLFIILIMTPFRIPLMMFLLT
jgi:hypothetical protein